MDFAPTKAAIQALDLSHKDWHEVRRLCGLKNKPDSPNAHISYMERQGPEYQPFPAHVRFHNVLEALAT
jgi:hypothetical protein